MGKIWCTVLHCKLRNQRKISDFEKLIRRWFEFEERWVIKLTNTVKLVKIFFSKLGFSVFQKTF